MKKVFMFIILSFLSPFCMFAMHYSHGTVFNDHLSKQHHYFLRLDKARTFVDTKLTNNTLEKLTPKEQKYIKNIIIISIETGKAIISDISKQKPILNYEEIIDQTISAWNLDELKGVYYVDGYYTTIAISKDRKLYILAINQHQE